MDKIRSIIHDVGDEIDVIRAEHRDRNHIWNTMGVQKKYVWERAAGEQPVDLKQEEWHAEPPNARRLEDYSRIEMWLGMRSNRQCVGVIVIRKHQDWSGQYPTMHVHSHKDYLGLMGVVCQELRKCYDHAPAAATTEKERTNVESTAAPATRRTGTNPPTRQERRLLRVIEAYQEAHPGEMPLIEHMASEMVKSERWTKKLLANLRAKKWVDQTPKSEAGAAKQ